MNAYTSNGIILAIMGAVMTGDYRIVAFIIAGAFGALGIIKEKRPEKGKPEEE